MSSDVTTHYITFSSSEPVLVFLHHIFGFLLVGSRSGTELHFKK